MALATQCPYCHTTFRVANDQLKLRAGLVRCGACKEIFNGIEHLLGSASAAAPVSPPLDTAAATVPAIPPRETAAAAENSAGLEPDAESASRSAALSASLDFLVDDSQPTLAPSATDEAIEPEATQDLSGMLRHEDPAAGTPEWPSTPLDQTEDPLQRMTLMEFSDLDQDTGDGAAADPAATADIDDPLDRVIDDLQRKPLRGSKKKASAPRAAASRQAGSDLATFAEPDFVTLGKRRQKIGRALRVSMAVGSCVLLIGLLAQAVYSFRNEIAARWPQAEPVLARACATLGCQLGLPMRIDALTIESSELQAVPDNKDTFVLTTLLRNGSRTVQAWPSIELTLTDANDQALARRVFAPREYLPAPQEATKGFAARSERAVKLFFEVAQLKAAGYRVGLFYP
ncbi:MAG TPA: DUF3426 domain-containing protein [Oxalobacteraceae bacterium]|nr:DUF3426 domain-containing protein [Oxalobacteraceae bacterium]